MVDADDPAIGRIDEVTDPEALTESEIKRQLRANPNLRGDAVDAFAEQIAGRREAVQEEARELLPKRLAKNPANPEVIQLRTQDGRLGPKVPDDLSNVATDVDSGGRVTATLEGQTVELGTIDLNAGAEGYQRSLSTYSTRQHPAQKPGGGGS